MIDRHRRARPVLTVTLLWGTLICLGAGFLMGASGCAGSPPREAVTPSGFKMLRVGDLAIAGQPSAPQLGEIVKAGYKTVITVRKPDEIDWNEAAEVTSRGMRFGQIPSAPETIEVSLLSRVRSMIEQSPKPVLLHCSSGNRAAIVWGMLEAGKRPDEEILQIAEDAGLKEQYRPLLVDYLNKHSEGKGRLR